MKLPKKSKGTITILIIILFSIHVLLLDGICAENMDVKKTYKFAGDFNHPPYEYVDVDGQYKGFNVDIMKAIANAMALDIEIVPMEWKDAITALDSNQVHGIIGMSQSPERLEKYQFITPTVINNQVIFVSKDTVHINELEDLAGLKVAYQKNDYNESLLLQISNVEIIPKGEQKDAILALGRGEVDAALGNQLVGIYHIQKNKLYDKVKIVGEPLVTTKYGPAIAKDNQELFNVLEEGLKIIKRNKTYDKIYKKWFGKEVNYAKLIYDIYKNEVLIFSGSILIIIIFLYIYNKKLQKEVLKRTGELEQANRDLIKHQNEIYNLAYYDSITSLPNRLYFVEELNNIYENIDEEESFFAVLLLDLDRFKHINDTLGHHVGDQILKLLGNRLSDIIKDGDIVARTGGDEYYILLNNLINSEEAIIIANNILEDFKHPYFIRDYELYLSTSIGISIYPEGGLDTQTMLKNADLALYKAKENGGNSYYLYGVEIESKGMERMMLLNQLRQAIDKDELVLHYQPLVDINSGEIIGLEALVRWENPERGLLYPDTFIPLAEETGLILQIGQWVLNEACRQTKEWIDEGHDLMISVNISAKQFQHKGFIKELVDALTDSGLNPENLTLEITETIAISDMEHTISLLRMLKSFGVAVAIDDFGTGYSSLSYLNEMSVNELKIDRSFIWDIEKNDKNKMISNTIILLGKQLGLKVIAEGVENNQQLSILKELKCDIAQGYHFSRPVPKEIIDEMINKKALN